MTTRHHLALGIFITLLGTLGVSCLCVDHVLFPPEVIARNEADCVKINLSCSQCASNERCGWCGLPDGTGGCHAITGTPKVDAKMPPACSARWYPRVTDCPVAGNVVPPDAAAALPPQPNK